MNRAPMPSDLIRENERLRAEIAGLKIQLDRLQGVKPKKLPPGEPDPRD